jgi:hypothetical protein
MAIHRTDRNTEIMKEDFGTVCLATDPRANLYLDRATKGAHKELTPDTLSRWCGGRGGFDVFTERLYE